MIDQAQIEAAIGTLNFGKPSAVRRGRDPRWPYIAIVADYLGKADGTHNPMGRRAYATRDEAIVATTRYLESLRNRYRRDLADPRMRALRESFGLPRELI